jgi:hypothetical protein
METPLVFTVKSVTLHPNRTGPDQVTLTASRPIRREELEVRMQEIATKVTFLLITNIIPKHCSENAVTALTNFAQIDFNQYVSWVWHKLKYDLMVNPHDPTEVIVQLKQITTQTIIPYSSWPFNSTGFTTLN